MAQSSPRRYAIVGHPVGHSLSPVFHNAAFSMAGISAVYEPLDVPPGDLDTIFSTRIRGGYAGLNVTAPHKVTMMKFLTETAEDAARIGAVNTLVLDASTVRGLNTDVTGIRVSLEPHRTYIERRSVLVFGAGGAARSVVDVLVGSFNPARILLANRTLESARSIAATYGDRNASRIDCMALDDKRLAEETAGSTLVVQTTGIGTYPNEEESIFRQFDAFHPGQAVFDLIYHPRETRLLREASRRGAFVLGGLEMFLSQAAASFTIWTGLEPDVSKIRPFVERQLARNG